MKVHRLVALYFCENPENKLTVNHIDGNRYNNCSTNLEWATQKEQMYHSQNIIKHNKIQRGEKSHFCKTSEKYVRRICELLEKGLSNKEIAIQLNIYKPYEGKHAQWSDFITKIRSGKSWKEVSSEYNINKKFSTCKLNDDVLKNICQDISECKSNHSDLYDVYKKYEKYFNIYSMPKAKFNDIVNKRFGKRISDFYF